MKRTGSPSGDTYLAVRLSVEEGEHGASRSYEVTVSGSRDRAYKKAGGWQFEVNWPSCGTQPGQDAAVFGSLLQTASAVVGHLEALAEVAPKSTSFDLLKQILLDNTAQVAELEALEQKRQQEYEEHQAQAKAESDAHQAAGKCMAFLRGGKGRCMKRASKIVRYAPNGSYAKQYPGWFTQFCGTHARDYADDTEYVVEAA